MTYEYATKKHTYEKKKNNKSSIEITKKRKC